jgi:hypothetical protein
VTRTRLARRRDAQPRTSLLARLTANPVVLRRRARLTTVVVALLSGLSYGFGNGGWPGIVLGLTWVAMPFLALGIALGDAFFVRHGRGVRRAALTALAGGVTALGACGALASVLDGAAALGRDSGVAALYALLYGASVALLAALLALGIGRGEGYLARKIQAVDDEGW